MNNIACIVVTYNRLELLKRCIDSLRKQSMKYFDICVINNGSTDGTKEWLGEQNDIYAITQLNRGGAGGFYTGMKYAYDKGYEWIWMMDDDGVADSHQLHELYKVSIQENYHFLNALVLNIDNPNCLAFGLQQGNKVIWKADEAFKMNFIETINPFNGTFLNRILIDKIGLIKKEMFIWGDEKEYGLRARANGVNYYTVTSAIHYHPPIKSRYVNVIPFCNKRTIEIKPKRFSHYYYRNIGYIYKNYYHNRLFRPLIAYSLYFLLHFKILELIKFLRYYYAGIRNSF